MGSQAMAVWPTHISNEIDHAIFEVPVRLVLMVHAEIYEKSTDETIIGQG